MVTITRREIRKRGIVGKLCLGVFFAFNLLMVYVLGHYLYGAVTKVEAMSPGPQADGAKAAVATVSLVILGFWGFGDLVLGMFVLLTRDSVTVIEEREQNQTARREPSF